MESLTPLAAVILLFLAVGVGFIFVHLVAGKLIRPNNPDAEKKTVYECGEPTIGSAWIQFDLRFYVVALLFVIFDVEVAFFFPWAEVFGKANNVAAVRSRPENEDETRAYGKQVRELVPDTPANSAARARYNHLKVVSPEEFEGHRRYASDLGGLAFLEIVVFFGVLLVGFAYLWRRGDLNWVRALEERRRSTAPPPSATLSPPASRPEPAEAASLGPAGLDGAGDQRLAAPRPRLPGRGPPT